MTSRDFAYWLQGFFEVNDAREGSNEITDKQIHVIKKHLNLVFKHEIDPFMGNESHQQELNEIHNPIAQTGTVQGGNSFTNVSSNNVFPFGNDPLIRC